MSPRAKSPPARAGARPLDLRYYMFDWDDNILHMPTRIHLEKKTARGWRRHDVSTAEFARIRRDTVNYRPRGGDWDKAFIDFYDVGRRGARAFLADTRIALAPVIRGRNKGAPSFEKFRKALIEGRLFAIITARSHSASSIRKGVEYFIDRVLTAAEKKRMIANLRGYIDRFGGDRTLTDRQVLAGYLDLNRYHGVSSPEFKERMGRGATGSESPERAKQVAIHDFVKHALSLVRGRHAGGTISMGFSDDDPHNVRAVEAYLRQELSRTYPGVKFVVYDTSNRRRRRARKIVIKRSR